MARSFARFTALFTILFSLIILLAPQTAYTAKAAGAADAMVLDAQGAILIDQHSGKVLYQKNENERLYPASTTKILTALLALEKGSLDDTITVGNEVNLVPWDSSKAMLKVGEQITLRELLMGLLLPSGNDAAETIAVYIGRKISGDINLDEAKAIDKFVELMNERAKELGATGSHFVNPHGYHDDNHYTTPHDLALFAREAMKHEYFREVVGTFKYDAAAVPVMNNGQLTENVDHTWVNTNRLISKLSMYYYEYATGIKTGYTTPAGECVVSSASKDGMDLIAVVMNSTTTGRWNDAKKLLEYGFTNFGYYKGTDKGEAAAVLSVGNHSINSPEKLTAVTGEDFIDVFRKDEAPKITKSIIWDENLFSPIEGEENKIKLLSSIKAGEVIGKEVFTLNGTVVKEIDLKAGEGVEKIGIASAGIAEIDSDGLTVGLICIIAIILMLPRRFIRMRRRRVGIYRYRSFYR